MYIVCTPAIWGGCRGASDKGAVGIPLYKRHFLMHQPIYTVVIHFREQSLYNGQNDPSQRVCYQRFHCSNAHISVVTSGVSEMMTIVGAFPDTWR